MQRESYKRRSLETMRDIFRELNSIPHDVRCKWGAFGSWADYDFALSIIDGEIRRLDKNNAAVKRSQHKRADPLFM